MEYSKLNFNKSLKSTDDLLNESLKHRTNLTDAINNEISSDELVIDIFRKRSGVLENIIEQEQLNIDAALILKKILEKNNEIIHIYDELKKVSLFKKMPDGSVINIPRPGKELEFMSLSQSSTDATDEILEYVGILKVSQPEASKLFFKKMDATIIENRTN